MWRAVSEKSWRRSLITLTSHQRRCDRAIVTKRDVKEASAGTGKRSRKRKSSMAQETAGKKTNKARRSELEIAEDEIAAAGFGRLLQCIAAMI